MSIIDVLINIMFGIYLLFCMISCSINSKTIERFEDNSESKILGPLIILFLVIRSYFWPIDFAFNILIRKGIIREKGKLHKKYIKFNFACLIFLVSISNHYRFFERLITLTKETKSLGYIPRIK